MTITETRLDEPVSELPVDLVIRKARDQILLGELNDFSEDTEFDENEEEPPPAAPQGTPKFTIKTQFASLSTPHGSKSPTDIPALVQKIDDEEQTGLGVAEQEDAISKLKAQVFGLGILEPLLGITNITDIFVNGPQEIWYEADGKIHRSYMSFAGEPDVRALATRLINSAGGRLDEAYPSADVHNDKGQRIHAMLPPLSRTGTVLSIRIQPQHRASLAELQEGGMFDAQTLAVLRYLLESKANFLISGGTGTGKTTLLNAMLSECSENERIVTIEDSAELAPNHSHVVSLQSKVANSEGQGAVGLSELIRQALRMRPNRLVLGECRGAELADMLTAMNTGHSGSGGTVHANSASAVPARLLAMGAMAGMNSEALSLQALTAVEYVIHISRHENRRIISEVAVLCERNGVMEVEPLGTLEPSRRELNMRWTEPGQLLVDVASHHSPENLEQTS